MRKVTRITLLSICMASTIALGAGITYAAYSKGLLVRHDGNDLLIGTNYARETVDFSVNYYTGDGYSLYVYNDLGTINGTTFPEYLPMYWTEGNNWKYSLTLPIGTTFHYKYVKAVTDKPTLEQTWELGGDDSLKRELTVDGYKSIQTGWNMCQADFRVEKDAGMGKGVFLRGNFPGSGGVAYRLSVSNDTIWEGSFLFEYSQSGYQFNYVVANYDNGGNAVKEGGQARILSFETNAYANHLNDVWQN